jgi:hypothetical protein
MNEPQAELDSAWLCPLFKCRAKLGQAPKSRGRSRAIRVARFEGTTSGRRLSEHGDDFAALRAYSRERVSASHCLVEGTPHERHPSTCGGARGIVPRVTPSREELRALGIDLFDRWTAMWNGDLAVAQQLMATDFTLRYAQANTEIIDSVRTPDAMAALVARWHGLRPGIRFSAEGEAAVDLDWVDGAPSGRVARPYLAVFVDGAGQTIARSGIDMLAVRGGRIVEVWSVSSGAAGRTFYAVSA